MHTFSELVAWHSWKLAVCCLCLLQKRGRGVWTTYLEIWSGKSSVALSPSIAVPYLPATYVYLALAIYGLFHLRDGTVTHLSQGDAICVLMDLWIQESSICGHAYCHFECKIASTYAAQ